MPENQQNMTIQEALELGIRHHQAGQLAEAESIYQQVLNAQPSQPIALHFLGVSAHQKGNNALAVDLINRAITLEPNYVEAHNNLGLALRGLGRTHEAIASCKKALSINPNYAEAHNNLGLALELLAKWTDAEACYRKAVELNPRYAIAYNNMGNVLQALGRMDDAVKSYRTAIEVDPNYANAHNNMGNALREDGKLEEALDCYKKSLNLNQRNIPALGNLGDILKDILYRKIRTPEQHASNGNKNLEPGTPQKLKKSWEEVLNWAEKALEIRANDTQALALKTSALIGLNRLEEWRLLCNFERFIESKVINVPDGYEDLATFNDALFKRCEEDPNLSYEQVGKSIKKGQRINAVHLDPAPGPIASLLEIANEAVQSYKLTHPQDTQHPYLTRIPAKWRFNAWGSILAKQGHHESHIHPSGWISGVYYGRLPKATKSGDKDGQGYIEFGRPSNHVKNINDPEFHLLQPDDGLLVLFPSYFYHQTIPFDSDEVRFTIAFDAIPEA